MHRRYIDRSSILAEVRKGREVYCQKDGLSEGLPIFLARSRLLLFLIFLLFLLFYLFLSRTVRITYMEVNCTFVELLELVK